MLHGLQEWRKAREAEIQQQQAVQLTYDWTFTTPYNCTVGRGPGHAAEALLTMHDGTTSAVAVAGNAAAAAAARRSSISFEAPASTSSSLASEPGPSAAAPQQPARAVPPPTSVSSDGSGAPMWVETSEQIERALLMERDQILFYDEVRRG